VPPTFLADARSGRPPKSRSVQVAVPQGKRRREMQAKLESIMKPGRPGSAIIKRAKT
jgi:hypothetical protein